MFYIVFTFNTKEAVTSVLPLILSIINILTPQWQVQPLSVATGIEQLNVYRLKVNRIGMVNIDIEGFSSDIITD